MCRITGSWHSPYLYKHLTIEIYGYANRTHFNFLAISSTMCTLASVAKNTICN